MFLYAIMSIVNLNLNAEFKICELKKLYEDGVRLLSSFGFENVRKLILLICIENLNLNFGMILCEIF